MVVWFVYLALCAIVASPILFFAFAAPWLIDWTRDATFYVSLAAYYGLLAFGIAWFAAYTAVRMAQRMATSR